MRIEESSHKDQISFKIEEKESVKEQEELKIEDSSHIGQIVETTNDEVSDLYVPPKEILPPVTINVRPKDV